MSINIDPTLLDSITQEARQCFLEEDAPEYLATLQQNLQDPDTVDFPAILRAAHSLKGGAGLAQMPSVSQLSHKLEDLLEGMRDGRVAEVDLAWGLIQRGVEEIAYALDMASTGQNVEITADLLQALEDFNAQLQSSPLPSREQRQLESTPGAAPPALVRSALQVDLEQCLERVESLITQAAPAREIEAGLKTLMEECTLLSEALSLPWLAQSVEGLAFAFDQAEEEIPWTEISTMVIEQVRAQRQAYLESLSGDPQAAVAPTEAISRPAQDLEEPDSGALQTSQAGGVPQVRLPLSRLETMADRVGELLSWFERLSLQQQQLKQASQELQRLSVQFQPIRDQVQALYDRGATRFRTTDTSPGAFAPSIQQVDSEADFDPLEMDQYTSLHRSLQNFEELISRVQETRSDIDLIHRELAENLEQGRQDLDLVYTEVTRSRLVPFRNLAQRFIPRFQRLVQRLGKRAELQIEGSEVLVDQIILEQLQTPMMHLLNNAVDHGIEAPEDRLKLFKPEVATVTLEASLEGNQVILTFADDGRGIDLQRVYQRAVERGLCPPEIGFGQLTREQVLEFIFRSGFSTAAAVSEVSGRGVGLDVVRQQITQLRGSLQVDSLPGKGTTFTIRLPLGLSLLPLMLCQTQRRLVAIPAMSVLEILPFGELMAVQKPDQEESLIKMVLWRNQEISVVPLATLLPYAALPAEFVFPRVAIVVDGPETPVAIAIDALVGERQLILKPFDDTIPVPPYVAGCTVLGTGDLVPVVLPFYFNRLLQQQKLRSTPPALTTGNYIVLVAEDSVATRRAIERILTQAGYITIPCRDGQEALDELRQRQGVVDLILTDIEMPRLSGFDLLQTVRTHSEWHALPVALLTSRTGDRHRQRAFSLGASAYLNKPVDAKILLREVNGLLPRVIQGVNGRR